MKRLVLLAVAFVGVAADCELEEPCQDYVDYICTCHADDPDFDCEELRAVFSDAGPDLQDQCAIDLAEQEEIDAEEGLECDLAVTAR